MTYDPVLINHVGEQNAFTLDAYVQQQHGYDGTRSAFTNTNDARCPGPAQAC